MMEMGPAGHNKYQPIAKMVIPTVKAGVCLSEARRRWASMGGSFTRAQQKAAEKWDEALGVGQGARSLEWGWQDGA